MLFINYYEYNNKMLVHQYFLSLMMYTMYSKKSVGFIVKYISLFLLVKLV